MSRIVRLCANRAGGSESDQVEQQESVPNSDALQVRMSRCSAGGDVAGGLRRWDTDRSRLGQFLNSGGTAF
jgi:hypothetical protein